MKRRLLSPDEPFRQKPGRLWLPEEMSTPPPLESDLPAAPIERRLALLINPFYPKDAHASFGKHVLTPTLALTSVAAATPPDWTVRYWDENLLQGPPPANPMPEVVGITVHLTFARAGLRAGRAGIGRAGRKVVLGGLHVLSCPEEAAPHADALAIGDGVQLWPRDPARRRERARCKPRLPRDYDSAYRDDPPPRRDLLPRAEFLTTPASSPRAAATTAAASAISRPTACTCPTGCATSEQVAREFVADGQPYAVFIDNNLGSEPGVSAPALPRPRGRSRRSGARRSRIDVTDDPVAGARDGAGRLHGRVHRLRVAHRREPRATRASGRPAPTTTRGASRILHDHGIQVNGSFVLGFDHDRPDVFEKTAEWIEENRLECATFHILTPYPGTPLFRQLEAEGRLLHRDWEPLRHGARRLPAEAHDPRGAGAGLRLAATGGCSRTPRSGGGAPATGAPSRRTWRCRTSTSARTGSGTS